MIEVDYDSLEAVVPKAPKYHGSTVPEIDEFESAPESTIGNGLYLTGKPARAIEYTDQRTRERSGPPVLYEVHLGDMRFLDLKDTESRESFLDAYDSALWRAYARTKDWNHQRALDRCRQSLDNEIHAGNLKKVFRKSEGVLEDLLYDYGFDGLLAKEGGEKRVAAHESWVVLNPQRIRSENIVEHRLD